jgi:hypothetical protein
MKPPEWHKAEATINRLAELAQQIQDLQTEGCKLADQLTEWFGPQEEHRHPPHGRTSFDGWDGHWSDASSGDGDPKGWAKKALTQLRRAYDKEQFPATRIIITPMSKLPPEIAGLISVIDAPVG